MADKPSQSPGILSRALAGLKRMLTGGGGGDLPPDVTMTPGDSPGNLSAFRGPAGGTLTGLAPDDLQTQESHEGKKSPPPARPKPGQAKGRK
jgi:hypothetical protein